VLDSLLKEHENNYEGRINALEAAEIITRGSNILKLTYRYVSEHVLKDHIEKRQVEGSGE